MGYIDIPVYSWRGTPDESYLDIMIDWFSCIHTNSNIDFSFDGNYLGLHNEEHRVLEVEGYTKEEVFELIEPKTDWEDVVWQDCCENMQKIDVFLDEHQWSNQELYNIYLDEVKNRIESGKILPLTWYVGDIQVKRKYGLTPEVMNGSERDILFEIRMEIRSTPINEKCYKYIDVKREMEDKLVALYYSEDDISMSVFQNDSVRKDVIGKMIIELKGFCAFEEVDALTLRREKIIKEKYPWYNLKNEGSNQLIDNSVRIIHPLEMFDDDVINEVIYDFPTEETWSDVMKAMGKFSSSEDDSNRRIRICEENIESTIRFMLNDKAFKRNLFNSVKVIEGNADEYKVIKKMTDILLKCVVLHELGHMTFRSIKKHLSLRERESLANWFSCLFGDLFERKLLLSLVPYQHEEYQNFIVIPDKYMLNKKKYTEYCSKIKQLLWRW